ncbi:hypothetical protein [Bartonella sp. HY038]|uniref:hypothetical protein n=1 Tax=Bartonella sp. HY038 TaxID=2759660 RepID=UPI0015F93DFF|nr:hypothetical protein [Bartonella sp. HY038]
MECIKKLEETGDEQYKTYIDLKPAIEKMRDGDFRNAADFIIGYEQKEINQRYYDENPWAFRTIRTGGFMTQKKHIPVTIECNSNKKPVTFNGNLTDYNDRIQYFWDLMNAWNGLLR